MNFLWQNSESPKIHSEVPPTLQFLADQLTLSQPGGVHYPHPVFRAPPGFSDLATALYIGIFFR